MLTRLLPLTLAAASFSSVLAQQVGTLTTETHPPLQVATCTKSGGCTNQQLSVTLDANWRWLHKVGSSTNCYTGNTWDATSCPDPVSCAQNCALDGADYTGTYGVTASGTALTLKFVTNGPYSTNIGSRLYLMQNDSTYMMLKLKNKEFTFDVDVSNLGCGLNGALYLSEMLPDGGMSKYANNKAGAKYGTGYCDSQCPHDIKFINGEANVSGWAPSASDKNAGSGTYGSCCAEMDLWEANKVSAAYTPHPCSLTGPARCSGTDCGDGDNRYGGVCDKDGCDFNSYRMGDTSFYGPGKTIDTTKPFTVVTQFITADGTDTGDLSEIRRIYVQNGVVHENSQSTIAGVSGNSISTAFCTAQKTVFGDTNSFQQKGGLKAMGDALGRGMVLVLSVWDDHSVNMLWLDSTYPTDKSASTPGVGRGDCPTTSGVPTDIEANAPNSSVKYFNIKWGEIGSTYSGTPASGGSGSTTTTRGVTTTTRPGTTTTTTRQITTTTRPITTTTTTRPVTTTTTTSGGGQGGNCVAKWGQCGGQGYPGATCCQSGSTCKYQNNWYSQCL